MAEQTDQRMERAVDVIVRMQRMQDPAAIKGFMPYIRKDAALLLEAIDGPEPDWADLREMARNAGWDGHADEPHVRIWGANGTDRMSLDWDAGSVRVFRHGLVVDLAGPSATYAHEAVHLINPTPARVLAAARLLGLVGSP